LATAVVSKPFGGNGTWGCGAKAHNPTRRWHNVQCRRDVSRLVTLSDGLWRTSRGVLGPGEGVLGNETEEAREMDGVGGATGNRELDRDRDGGRGHSTDEGP